MSATATQITTSIRVVGGLLPADMIARIAVGKDVSASMPVDYHVVGVRSVKDAAERHWDYLKGAWRALRDAVPGDSDPRGLAIENWLLPLFDELGYGRLTRLQAGITADDGSKVFPVSHAWQHLLVNLVPWEQDLDKRPAVGVLPAQSMVQECLNRTGGHLWAILSNGSVLRLLRDTTTLTGSAYLEIDLAAMFDGELFDEFVLLYRLLHVSRFEIVDGAPVSSCQTERWRTEAIEAGTRALDQLRDGVKAAIEVLATGFLKEPANADFRRDFDKDLVKRGLLRLVYRLLFWFVAEDRDALHAPNADEKARKRYATYFSARRLRDVSLRGTGTAHGDQWQAVRLILNGLGAEAGLPHLGLPGLGGIYDDTPTDALLADLELSNEQLLTAVRALSRVRDKSTNRWRRIDYRNLGAEELGAIYESLLALAPDRDGPYTFVLREAAANEQKSTGSFYTPTSLIDCLLDSTLDPVLDDTTKQAEIAATTADKDPSEAIAEALLKVTVCDPACGSGHFLVAAARRIAKRVASVREHSPEPTVESLRTALRDVIARCIYGVDLNEMAVELAKVSLWLEALDPGKPLSFLAAHIRHGNALIGATPKLIDGGIPDAAFKAVEPDDRIWGDDKKFAASLARVNAADNPGQFELFSDEVIFSQTNTEMAADLARIAQAPEGSLRDVHEQAAAYRQWTESDERQWKLDIANAWCAAFVWRKHPAAPPAIVNRVFRALSERGRDAIPPATAMELDRLRDEYHFFHWHLEFPDIFQVPDDRKADVGTDTGWVGGFDVLLGNPPWDKVDFEDKKYFGSVESSIANMAGQARRTQIREWEREHPEDGKLYRAARRRVKATFLFVSSSAAYPNCTLGLKEPGVNSLQTDQLFAELFDTLAAPVGRAGCIIPTAIATGAGGQHLFDSLAKRGGVASLYDFENRKPLFPAVHSSYKFCLLSLTGRAVREPTARFAFFLLDTPDLDNPGRVFALTPEELGLINPNTGTLPIFRNQRDASITVAIYRRMPVLWNETIQDGNQWGINSKRLFDSIDDSGAFRTREELVADGWHLHGNVFTRDRKRMLPIYEAKMTDYFNHRAADVIKSETAVNRQNQPRYLTTAELADPARCALPSRWIAEDGPIIAERNGKEVKVLSVSERLAELSWERDWLVGWRNVTAATNERTAIPAFIPRVAVWETFSLMFSNASTELVGSLVAAQSSMVFDFVSRQKIGGLHMQLFIWKQLPVPAPASLEPHLPFIVPRVLELVYTAYDMTPLARDLGDQGEPFRWDEDRRAQLRAELDAFFFRLYGIDDRNDVDYILETFQTETGGLKHNEIRDYGEYHTKRLVLTEYDRMAAADAAGTPYQSPLPDPPGHGPRHPAREHEE